MCIEYCLGPNIRNSYKNEGLFCSFNGTSNGLQKALESH